jgi:hypothetical protein
MGIEGALPTTESLTHKTKNQFCRMRLKKNFRRLFWRLARFARSPLIS